MEVQTQIKLEWLETNGIGGFASGAVNGPPLRRYHGVLCASFNPPTDRHLLVSHLIEQVAIEDRTIPLSTEYYEHHRPDTALKAHFTPRPYAHWEFELPGGRLEKSVTMLEGENTSLVRYKNTGLQPLRLFVKPLIAARDYHALRSATDTPELSLEGNTVAVQFRGYPNIFMAASLACWKLTGDWYYELYYDTERERGADACENNFSAAEIVVRLAPSDTLVLRFSTQPGVVSQAVFKAKDRHYKNLPQPEPFQKDLAYAAQQFIVHRESGNGSTILAGYPWFTDWGRDTLIALRDFQDFMEPAEAQIIIKTFLQYQRAGLIPNRFPDDPEDAIEYNTVDGTLWWFVAVWELFSAHPDKLFIEQVYDDLTQILEAHLGGTNFNIGVNQAGLLEAGQDGWQLTWMDAKIDGFVVTPRSGMPVEVNALWYNALKIYQQLGQEIKQSTINVAPWIKQFEKSFSETFWNAETGGLYDCINFDGTPDKAVRPNQIYAVSLPFSPLRKKQQKQILKQVTTTLYTPLGLRTLSPADGGFKTHYTGDSWARDTAYHQGTVWPFLLREYWVAYEKIYGSRKTRKLLSQEIHSLKDHFYNDAGVGSVSEVFDGETPRHGKGCPQQAWSVAALWKMVKLLS